MTLRRAALLAALVLAVAGCGGGSDEGLTVFAAASLTEVFGGLDPEARFNFAGSDELATQLRQGARADVYAAASTRYADELRAEGIVEQPRVFATNRLVLIVPRDSPHDIASLADVPRDLFRLVVAAEGVPVGDYTRDLLRQTGNSDLLERVVSNEDDVKGVVSKVALGEADGGFVYATDVTPVADRVRAVELPAEAQPDIRYPVAIVAGTEHGEEARRFVRLLLGPEGRSALAAAGFGLP